MTSLRQAAISRELTGELNSIDTSFATAERYRRNDDQEMAERYYQLCIQKSRVLFSSLAGQGTAPSLPPPAVSSREEAPEQPARDDVGNGADPVTDGAAAQDGIVSRHLVGQTSVYTVRKQDTLRLISAKLGVSQQHLIMLNRLASPTSLKPGRKLVYNNRKIIPRRMSHGIVINIPDRTLYYFKEGRLATTLPVALGVPRKGTSFDWMTPTGKFRVVAKQKDPTWYVPRSIRSEMEARGKDVKTVVPPGPRNPLGKYAIKTSLPGILIHSTTMPGSIYRFASHGCIRVYPEQMKEFFDEVRVNTPGEIIYQPVKLAVTEEGRVFLEVHQDAYNRGMELQDLARQMIEKRKLSEQVDWDKVESVVRRREGLAEDVTL